MFFSLFLLLFPCPPKGLFGRFAVHLQLQAPIKRIHATKNCIHGSRSGTSQFVSGSWSHGHLSEDNTTVASSTKCGKFHTDLQSRAEEKGATQENFKKHVYNMGKYINRE